MTVHAAAPHHVLAAFISAALMLTVGFAGAQSDEQRAAARSLALEGAKACEEARWKECADLFQRAESIVHAPPHLLYQARAHEKLGHIVKARELYLKIARERLADNAPEAFRKAQAVSSESAQKLEPLIGYLTIKVEGGDPSSVTVTFDGEVLPAALVGVSRPVDPGEHKIEAKGATLAASPQVARIAEGARETITLTLEPAAATAAAAPEEAPAPQASATAAPADSGADNGKKTLRIASFAALGVGVVGAAVGTIFALKSKSNRGDADALYAEQCTPQCFSDNPAAAEVASLDDSARSAKTLSIIGFAVGGVGIGAGVALFFLSRGHESPAATSTGKGVSPWVGLGSAGVSGRF